MSTTAPHRPPAELAFFSYGFRPFFFSAAVWAALAVPLWAWSFLAGSGFATHRDWHVHEMLFGFLGAVIAGFLTTAIPNWTGRTPVRGAALAGLWGLWLAGRVAMLAAYWLGSVAAVIDAAFFVALAGLAWREVLLSRNWRNAPVCLLVTLLALANVLFHLDGAHWGTGIGARAALGVSAVLLALIGGRIVPSFTRNWLAARGAASSPAPFGGLDKLALAATSLAAVAWTAAPERPLTAGLLVAAGLVNLVRLSRWRGPQTWHEPLLWILHAGYAWLGAGLILLGLSGLSDSVPPTAGVHALTAGAVGVMTLAVMSRASRGHTGRALTADHVTTLVYLAALGAAACRVVAPFAGAAMPAWLMASAALWTAAFAAFAISHAPMFFRPPLAQ